MSAGHAGPTHAPWDDAERAALEIWQADTRRHPITCIDHSDVPMLVTSRGLLCAVDDCAYTQRWVPGVCLRGIR